MKMMKHRYMALLWTALCLLAGAPSVVAQEYTPVPVTISRTTVNMNGQNYYMHIVLERQTLYGITKAYKVTEEDLYEANPNLREEGLKSGSVIYIPVTPGKGSEKASGKTTATKTVTTKTEKTEKDARKPVVDTTPAKPVVKDGYIEHTVKWFEDIYDVANAYGVTTQEIMDANGLRSSRISKRQTLLIPVKSEEEKAKTARQVPPPTMPDLADPEVSDIELTQTETYDPIEIETPEVKKAETLDAQETEETDTENDEDGIFDWFSRKGTVEMALVLPFNASGSASESNMDFYSGVLMALRDLERDGVKSTLNVVDLQAGLPSAFELGKNDFVLGPISSKDLTSVLERTGGSTPVISPLDQRAASLVDSEKGFIQAPSSASAQYADLAAWAAEDAEKGDQIILVTERSSNGSAAPAVGVREALIANGTSFEGVSWTQSEGRSLPAALTSRLTRSGVNRIIVASEKETFVADIVRNIGILLGRGYDVVMYAPSKVRTFDTVDGSAYHQIQLHISSPYFADYDRSEVKDFVRTYRSLYRTDPSQFAFQGYDLTRYFAGMCAKYGNNWPRALGREPGSGLHTDFRFEKAGDGSYRNTGIRRIIYHTDYSTELVK